MATPQTATPAEIAKSNEAVEIMEGAQTVIETLLTAGKGDLQYAANAMKPYEIAQRTLKNLIGDMQRNPEATFEAMKLMLDFSRTAHQNVASDVNQTWRLEREASAMLTAAITEPTKYSHNGGGMERLPFYQVAINMVKGYLSAGQNFIRVETSWYGANGSNGNRATMMHEVSVRKKRNVIPIEVCHIHQIAAELWTASLPPLVPVTK